MLFHGRQARATLRMMALLISKTDDEIRGKSFVYVLMKKVIGDDEAEKAISKITFTKDKKVIWKALIGAVCF